jgi:hypothetical protein
MSTPPTTKAKIKEWLRLQVADPKSIRNAYIAEPALKARGTVTRYIVCLKFEAKDESGKYQGKEFAAFYYAKEAGQQLAVLREKWPLADGATRQASSRPGLKTFARWRWVPSARSPRQWAGPLHDRRAHLLKMAHDPGPVDAEAKDLATKQLTKLAARNAAKQTAAAKAKPKPAPTTEKPTQLRDQVWASLLRRRA